MWCVWKWSCRRNVTYKSCQYECSRLSGSKVASHSCVHVSCCSEPDSVSCQESWIKAFASCTEMYWWLKKKMIRAVFPKRLTRLQPRAAAWQGRHSKQKKKKKKKKVQFPWAVKMNHSHTNWLTLYPNSTPKRGLQGKLKVCHWAHKEWYRSHKGIP